MEEILKIYSVNPPGLMRSDDSGFDINNMPIGMAYVPWQTWQDTYEKDKALMRGTLFKELDKPFKGVMR